MIREHDVVDPPNQGEMMKMINIIKAGGAVLKLFIRHPGRDELSVRRSKREGSTITVFDLWVDSIHDVNGNPYVIGYKEGDETTMARLETVNTDEPDKDMRPLRLVVTSSP